MTLPAQSKPYFLCYDGGQHADEFAEFPPGNEIEEARMAAPDEPVYVTYSGMQVAWWPPLEDGLA